MLTEILIAIIFLVLAVVAVAEFFVFQKNRKLGRELNKREEEAKYKMFEITILNELNEKIGYSLGPHNIIEAIIRYLPDIVDYSAVFYVLSLPEKTVFKGHLKESVSERFVLEAKEKMLESTGFTLNVEEKFFGSDIQEDSDQGIGSFFEVPIEIGNKTAGMLLVARKNTGLYGKEQVEAVKKIAQLSGQAVTRLQEVVEAENSRMEAMVKSMTDGVIMTDNDYQLIAVNPAAKKAAGLENKSDLVLQDFFQGFSSKIDLKDKLDEVMHLEKVFVSDELLINDRFFKIVVAPVKDKNNWKTLGCVIVLRDITKEKEVETIKEDFTSMIVHELRSPLDSIKKMVELMRGTGLKKARQSECLQLIYGSSSDMLELVNNLLDMAKIEAGKFELFKQPSDIKEIVNNRVSFFDIAAKDANVALSSQFGKDIPDKVSFDPRMVSEALNNFISNAMKFSIEQGSVIIQVLLYEKEKGIQKKAKQAGIKWFVKKDIFEIPDSLFVAVTNTGQGIAESQISKLFYKFSQAKTVFAKKAGTGLGLAITKSIIESHKGIVGVESVEGKGATFYFTIPKQ